MCMKRRRSGNAVCLYREASERWEREAYKSWLLILDSLLLELRSRVDFEVERQVWTRDILYITRRYMTLVEATIRCGRTLLVFGRLFIHKSGWSIGGLSLFQRIMRRVPTIQGHHGGLSERIQTSVCIFQHWQIR